MSKLFASERTKILLILSLLEKSDHTGYSLIRQMQLQKEFAFALEEGFIYPLLHQMQQNGWITSYEKQTEVGLRRFYQIKRLGRKLLCSTQYHPKKALGGEVCVKSTDGTMAASGVQTHSESTVSKTGAARAEKSSGGQDSPAEK